MVNLSMVVTAISLCVFFAVAHADQEYLGFQEIDKGNGVYVLTQIDEFGSRDADIYRFAGTLAEFIRRHSRLRAVSVFSVVHGYETARTTGIVILTEPRGK